MSQCVPPCIYPAWDSLCFLELVGYFLSHIREISAIISSNIFSGPFSLSSFWEPYNAKVGVFNVLPACLHFFSFFFLYSVLWQWFPRFCPPGHLCILLPQLFCCGFLLVHYLSVCLFFSSCRSLVNILQSKGLSGVFSNTTVHKHQFFEVQPSFNEGLFDTRHCLRLWGCGNERGSQVPALVGLTF